MQSNRQCFAAITSSAIKGRASPAEQVFEQLPRNLPIVSAATVIVRLCGFAPEWTEDCASPRRYLDIAASV